MVGTYELVVEALSVLLALATVGVCLYRRSFWQYLFLNTSLLYAAFFSIGCYYVRTAFGYSSPEYFYFYYVGDALGTIVLYLLIASFFDRLLRESVFHKYVRPTLFIFFLLVVGVSARFMLGNYDRFYSRFMAELQQNMFFVGVLLTLLLWISMGYLAAESRRFVLLVSGLGIYFASHAARYALQIVFPNQALADALTRVPPLMYTVMVLLWLYAFWRVPETEAVVEAARAAPRPALAKANLTVK